MPDKFTYPGTEILINIPGIRDQDRLDLAERNLARSGPTELRITPMPGSFNFPHLKAIHRRLVGDRYEWAGEIRTTDTQAMGTGVAHCRPEFIETFAKDVFAGIAADNFLLKLDHGTFAARLAHHWGELDPDAVKEARVVAIPRSSEPLRELPAPAITPGQQKDNP